MANLDKTTSSTFTSSQKETLFDKTARIVRRITEDEAELRHQKTANLRKDRIKCEADTTYEKNVTMSDNLGKET
jgi:hypothetical protein